MAATQHPGASATPHQRKALSPRVLLLEQHPDLAAHIDAEHRGAARTAVSAPAATLAPGPWFPSEATTLGTRAFGILVLDGLIARTIDIGNHPGLELFAAGDVIGTSTLGDYVLPAGDSWAVTVPSRIAVLDDEFLVGVRRWPRIVTGLVDQMQRQRDRLALQLVVAEQPRVEDRLLALFWLLSERFGRVGKEGVVIALKLTHEALGRLIGAQRPTVTLALKALRARGAVVRLADGGWLLSEQPDDALIAASQLPAGHHPTPTEAPTASG